MAVNEYIVRYEWHLTESLKEAILVQKGVVNKAKNAYNHVVSLGLCAGGGRKGMWIVRYNPCKGANLEK